jgi:hypothetical protein
MGSRLSAIEMRKEGQLVEPSDTSNEVASTSASRCRENASPERNRTHRID